MEPGAIGCSIASQTAVRQQEELTELLAYTSRSGTMYVQYRHESTGLQRDAAMKPSEVQALARADIGWLLAHCGESGVGDRDCDRSGLVACARLATRRS